MFCTPGLPCILGFKLMNTCCTEPAAANLTQWSSEADHAKLYAV